MKIIFSSRYNVPIHLRGWSGGAMGLSKLPVPGRPIIWIKVGRGACCSIACLDFFTLLYLFSPPFLALMCRKTNITQSLLSSFSLCLGNGLI